MNTIQSEQINDMLYVEKIGKLVILKIYSTAEIKADIQSWVALGVLPEWCRPIKSIEGMVYDYKASAHSKNLPYDLSIKTDGAVKIFLFSDKLSISPVGNIAFFTN